MANIGILDPREFWSAGVASLCREWGYDVAGPWSSISHAMLHPEPPPDVLLLSSSLISAEVQRAFGTLHAQCAILLVLDSSRSPSAVFPALPIRGIVAADARPEQLRPCLQTLTRAAARPGSGDPGDARPVDPKRLLSSRELEIARLAAGGRSNKAIAKVLQLSDGTVKMHMHHVFTKLHLPSRGALASLPGLGDEVAATGTGKPPKPRAI